jgi:hypothetical protein
MRSESSNDQLKDSIKNDYSKGILGVYPSTIPNAMMRMNEFRPIKIEKTVPPAMGTAFAGAGDKKGGDKKKSASVGVGLLLAEEWHALSDAEKAKPRKENSLSRVCLRPSKT